MPNTTNTVIITKGITAWTSTYPYESRIEGHSAIYPHGGYYKLNVDGARLASEIIKKMIKERSNS